ncbi:hypothetical protein Salat_1846900 [Sesamum alatum]|uniref:Uncharacterized protein n=1 Tax=Sesamum alatum TaxID=300844 RepID=A0AAE2CHX6_9LAMI|nr:hypothetical protein Salat_1846900 [Sesamum alatum]
MGIVSNAVWMVLLLLICASAADNEMVAGAVSASLRRPPAGVALSASRRPPPAGVALSASRRPPPAGAVSVNRYPPYYRCTSNLGPCGRSLDESDCQRLCLSYYSGVNPKAYCNIYCFCEHTCL